MTIYTITQPTNVIKIVKTPQIATTNTLSNFKAFPCHAVPHSPLDAIV
jgi:hypothetical protein